MLELRNSCTDLYLFPNLALRLLVSVVSALHLPVAGEGGVGNLGKDRIVVARHTRDRLLQGGEVVLAAIPSQPALLSTCRIKFYSKLTTIFGS